jgi:hypothetical protein
LEALDAQELKAAAAILSKGKKSDVEMAARLMGDELPAEMGANLAVRARLR